MPSNATTNTAKFFRGDALTYAEQLVLKKALGLFPIVQSGEANLVGGTVTVACPRITNTCVVLVGLQSAPLGVIFELKASRINNTSFTIVSTELTDNITISYQVQESNP